MSEIKRQIEKEDFMRMIDGEMWYKSDYCYWLYEQIKERDDKIKEAIEYITHEWFKREQIGISHLSFSYDELQHILDILRGEDNDKS